MAKLLCLPPTLRHATLAFFLPASRHMLSQCHHFITRRTMATSSSRTYADALALLEKLQSNRTVVSSISNSSKDMNLDAIPEMLEWTRRAGYSVSDLAQAALKCVHVAGTKGKGSVCTMVEAILLQYSGGDRGEGKVESKYLDKVGMYTSPHLLTVRERIRINGHPISEPLFTRYFFELWDRFSAAAPDTDPDSAETKPGYFRYLTILAFHTFIREGVKSVVIECGIGGEYDSTNILPPEAVTASVITTLGIDHVGMLGETIEEIAWHKGGILKNGVPAFTIGQVPAAQAVLEKRAAEKGVKLQVADWLRPEDGEVKVDLAMEGNFQQENAALAVSAAASHLRSLGITAGLPSPSSPLDSSLLPTQFTKALRTASLPGRCQTIRDGTIEWLIDGAHTHDSITAVSTWFIHKLCLARLEARPPTATMLIFNQADRDAEALLTNLIRTMTKEYDRWVEDPLHRPLLREMQNWATYSQKMFTYAAFCRNEPFKGEVERDLGAQEKMARYHQGLDGNSLHMCYGSVEEAVDLARKVAEGDERVLVLVTGSLHLVGGLLKVLQRDGVVEA
jgi:folylpolyglutamate synthase